MDVLDIETHRAATICFYPGDPASEAHCERSAQEAHLFHVDGALLKLLMLDLPSIQAICNEEARRQLVFGVLRRLGMICAAFRGFRGSILPDRIAPLRSAELGAINRDLNSIYINVAGILDNFAWFLAHQCGMPETKGADPREIGLFRRSGTFAKDRNLAEVLRRLATFGDWARDLADRHRAAAAHRMPLYVPFASLTPQEEDQRHQYAKARMAAVQAGDLGGAREFEDLEDSVGTFVPVFLYDDREAPTQIYPTIPSDLSMIVKISRIIETFVRQGGR